MDLLKTRDKLFGKNIFQDWKTYARLIRTNTYIIEVSDFLNKLKMKVNQPPIFDNKLTRKFIGAYTMLKFDMYDKNNTKDIQLYYLTNELISIFEKDLSNNNIELFFTKLSEYFQVFQQWKEHDEKILLDKSCTQSYKEIQVMKTKFTGNTPDEQQLSRSASMLQKKFETRIRQIGGERAMRYVNDSPKLEPIDVMYLDMEDNMKKAYWDMFEEDVNNNNLEPIGKNLDDFRKYFFELLGNSTNAQTIKNKFDDQVDIQIIKQMIDGNAINNEEIYKIMNSLIWYIKTYVQSASEDSDSEVMIDNIYKKFEERKEKTGTILRYFFQNIFQKLDKTKVQINLFKL